MKAASQRIIAEKLTIKDAMMSEIVPWMTAEQLSQAEAAVMLGVTSQCVADVINKHGLSISMEALVGMLVRTGKPVKQLVQ